MSALVSIVMPAWNAAATIAAAAASVVAQSHREWELLIVSDDGCDYARLIGEAGISDARIRFLADEGPARGPAAARNIGQRHAAGELITRLDADDLYEPDRLRLMVPLALRHGVAGDNAAAHDESRGGVLGTVLPVSEGIVPLVLFELVLSPIPWCLLFRRDSCRSGTRICASPRMSCSMRARSSMFDRVPVLGRALWRYRVMASSLSHAKGAAELADATYTRLIAECESGQPRLRKPELAALAGAAHSRPSERSTAPSWPHTSKARRRASRNSPSSGVAGRRPEREEYARARPPSARARSHSISKATSRGRLVRLSPPSR